jgi:nucleotide-binding universal stress UspA family protein
VEAAEWLERFAAALGVEQPSEEDRAALLSLAAVAANASERAAAPISCWLVAKAGRSPEEALKAAREVAAEATSAP